MTCGFGMDKTPRRKKMLVETSMSETLEMIVVTTVIANLMVTAIEAIFYGEIGIKWRKSHPLHAILVCLILSGLLIAFMYFVEPTNVDAGAGTQFQIDVS